MQLKLIDIENCRDAYNFICIFLKFTQYKKKLSEYIETNAWMKERCSYFEAFLRKIKSQFLSKATNHDSE